MSALSGPLSEYLLVRRALGYKLERAEKLLGQFVSYCEAVEAPLVTTELAVGWAKLPAEGGQFWWAQRLSVVRCFARWLQAQEPATEVPPAGVVGPVRPPRAVPYLYTDAEVSALMDATERLRWPLSRATYRALVGLLVVSAMRVGEAIRLDCADVDFGSGTLNVRCSKFGKSRLVPLHPSTVAALRAYASRRDELCPEAKAPSFFLSSAGTRLIYCNVSSLFRKLVGIAGLQARSSRCRPRIHDFRHLFAVSQLLNCYRSGGDVEALLPVLATFMGHSDPKHTYWYLSSTPELLALVASRLERCAQERAR